MNEQSEVVSLSLISSSSKPGVTKEHYKKFCLGLPDWCPCCIGDELSMAENDPNGASKRKGGGSKSLQLNKRSRRVDASVTKDVSPNQTKVASSDSDDRFSFDVTIEELDAFKEGDCPANTTRSTEWALRKFESWRTARNKKHPTELCPSELFATKAHQEICDWLCKFVSEARKGDGMEYTPRSLYLLLSALQRHIRKLRPLENINLFQDPVFCPLKNVCNAIFKRLHSKGIGTETKATPVLSTNEEDVLWSKGILSLDNPIGLMNAVFFYNGKNFCLRGGAEHRSLRISQFKKETSTIDGKKVTCYIYNEFGSKNNQGGLASLNQSNKTVRQYASESERCHVKILDQYFNSLPPNARDNDVFYLQPLSDVPKTPSAPWYKSTPIGKNTLSKMMKNMCEKAEISGGYTNHSLRAYGATTLFQAQVPEKLIQQRTGHRSLDALRQYERTSPAQLLDVSNVMSGTSDAVNPSNGASLALTKQNATHVLPAVKEQTQNQVNVNQPLPSLPAGVQLTPMFIVNNCTFSGCSVAISGQQAACQSKSTAEVEQICEETLKGVDIDDIFG